MADGPVLVVGASGALGGAIARKLLAAGTPVRAASRSAEKLRALADAGAETVAVDMLNLKALTEACAGATDIVATANNALGTGPNSPTKVDLSAYQNLCAAARNAQNRRIIHTSYRQLDQDSVVDFFRVKWYVADAIRRSGVPYVLMGPTAFMDTWIRDVMLPEVKKRGAATVFGDGTSVTNYIALDDVAQFAVKIVADPGIVNEKIDMGGPSNLSQNDLASLVERRVNATGKRRKVPVLMLKILSTVIRPFNELTARQMAFGLHTATESRPFDDWKKTADRFGITPRSVEDYLAALEI